MITKKINNNILARLITDFESYKIKGIHIVFRPKGYILVLGGFGSFKRPDFIEIVQQR